VKDLCDEQPTTTTNKYMEAIKANEINEIIRAQIENFDSSMTVDEVGTVIKVGDGIAEVHGLEKVMAGELLEYPHGVAVSRSTSKKIRSVPCCSATSRRSKKATK
jgi:F0F1-type ATP synthase alpha subunit